jgi:microcystin-dependent protein
MVDITHRKVATYADQPDAEINKAEWNDSHQIDITGASEGDVLTVVSGEAEWQAPTGGSVDSVNGQTGVVVLDAADVGAATAAQGSLADSALQSGDNVSTLVNDAGYLTSYTETDTLQTVTNRGASTTNTVTISPSGNNKALVANGSGSGIGIDITHSGSGVKLNIGSSGSGDAIRFDTDKFVVNDDGDISSSLFTADTILSTNASKELTSLNTATYPSLTEVSYVKGVTSAIQTQINNKQDTLVSGANIKTINSTTILGSGNIAVATAAQGALADTAIQSTEKGAANGVAPLGSDSKISTTYLPAAVLGAANYQGVWNASTNTPTLTSSSGTKGFYYVVDVAGSTNLNGITDWKLGDWAIYNGTAWEKVDNTDAVISVNSQIGAVVLDADDISDSSTTNKFTNASDISRLANTSGTNTGDQDLSSYATTSAVAAGYQPLATVLTNTTASFTTAQETKLAGIEALADVTDTTNVTAAGALMDSEVTSLSGIKTLTVPDNTTISTLGAAIVSRATPLDVRNDINAQENLNSISISTVTAAADDKIFINDTSAFDVLRFTTPQTILDILTFNDTDDFDFTRSTNAISAVLKATAISAKSAATLVGTEEVLVNDAGTLKKTTTQAIANLAGGVPSGSVMDYAGATLPTDWLWCDGSVISRTTYADLFTAIGTTYGAGDGSTTFALPDLRGRVSAGKDNMDNTVGTGGGDAGRLTSGSKAAVDGDTLGASGGVQEHLLLHEESGVPAHSHPYNRHNTVARTSTGANTAGTGNLAATTSNNTAADAAQAHTNVQPTLVLNKIIKI